MRRSAAVLLVTALFLGSCASVSPNIAAQANRPVMAPPERPPTEPSLDLAVLPERGNAFPLARGTGLRPWLRHAGNRVASDGAILFDYGRRYGNAGWQFTPVVSGIYCTAAYNEYLGGAPGAEGEVIGQADALLLRAEQAGAGILWRYRFGNEAFGAHAGWISGMGQGLAIGCLAAAYAVTHEQRYLDGAHRAFLALRAPFGGRGTAVRVRGGVFYEEVAGGGSRPSHILNGHVFALTGLWFLDRVHHTSAYRAALDQGIAGVRSLLGRFLVLRGSLYNLDPPKRAPQTYHVLHAEQFVWLYRVTRDARFLRAALRIMRTAAGIEVPVVSSEERDPRRVAALFDERPESKWTGERPGSWLLIDAGRSGLRITACTGAGPARWAFSHDLRTWSSPAEIRGTAWTIEVPSRYIALVWPDGRGCAAEMDVA